MTTNASIIATGNDPAEKLEVYGYKHFPSCNQRSLPGSRINFTGPLLPIPGANVCTSPNAYSTYRYLSGLYIKNIEKTGNRRNTASILSKPTDPPSIFGIEAPSFDTVSPCPSLHMFIN